MIKRNKIQTPIAVLLVVILSVLIYFTYDEYKKTILNQQMQNMLGNSRSISRSIELFLKDTTDSMKIITMDKEFIKEVSNIEKGNTSNIYKEKIETYYKADGGEIDSVYFIDKTGKIITRYPQGLKDINDVILKDINTALLKRHTYIGNAYLNKEKNNFILNIYEPVFDGNNFVGMVSTAINLNEIYDNLIAPVKVGEKGYALVKDQKGIIIMHTVKEQVGMDVIETRKQVYPNLDYKELEKLIEDQLKGKEGTAIYHSYWWGENILRKARKLNAYTPVNLGDHFWVVALTMSYDEIQQPINRFLVKLVGITSLIVIIIYFFVFALIKMKKNKEELEKETKYLKMLNETSEQLRKKEAELNHSHKLKMIGTLAGGIAHDINNLLTPILGYSELLLMRISEDEEYYDDIDEIYKASQKGRDLIEQILLFSRNDKGILKIGPININEVTKDTIKLVKAIIPKNVAIVSNIDKYCGFVNANFTQIHQVIFNLCTNAYQAIKHNKGIIEINMGITSAEEICAEGMTLQKNKSYVELTVRDNGCGMDEETKLRIFDPFFTTKEIGEGTGLGLYVAQNIISKYEGFITVESQEDIGSCFRVYLPLMDEEQVLDNDEPLKLISTNQKQVMVVDDNKNVVKMLKKGLEHLGYKVVSETDSMKALKFFQKNFENIDLVITDQRMPNIKGTELANFIKEIKKDALIILMTGYMEEGENSINSSEFIDAFIAKPIELAKLSELMQKLFADLEV